MIRVLAFLLLLAIPAKAQSLLTPEAFESLSKGRTLHFTYFGQAFGSEQYFQNRRVLWKPSESECDYGYWFPADDAICFAYERLPDPVCWHFLESGGKHVAISIEQDPGLVIELEIAGSDTKPLNCPGPDVGS